MHTSRTILAFLAVTALVGCNQTASVSETQPVIIDLEPVVIQGSDTEVQLVSSLVEEYSKDRADADISVTGGGSAVGIAALLNGEADIANSSRKLKEEEMAIAKEKGMQPVEFIVARDGLSIIVHPSNGVKKLSVEQVGSIFRGDIANWKEVGGKDAQIVLYGRQSTSGTFGFFRDVVVKDDYAASLRQMEGSQAIVDAVAADTNGIGYVGVGYVKDETGALRTDLAVVPISVNDGGEATSPLDSVAVLQGRYPISRPIYQYLAAMPEDGSVIDGLLEFEASAAGKAIIEKMGFYEPSEADKAANALVFGAQ